MTRARAHASAYRPAVRVSTTVLTDSADVSLSTIRRADS